MTDFTPLEVRWMRRALRLARRGEGMTSPNPAVGAVLVRAGRVLGQGWHRSAGEPHAEIEALRDAVNRGFKARGASLFVTLEPCCTQGRTPPCTEAILAAGVKSVTVATLDPNPKHCGRGLEILRSAGIAAAYGLMSEQAEELNEAFNHWIVHRRPFVVAKAAMSLDGRIATVTGDSKWITGEPARIESMRLRRRADAILVGIRTVLADDPELACREGPDLPALPAKRLRRVILDCAARTPPCSRVVSDARAELTTIVVGETAPRRRLAALESRAKVWIAPVQNGMIALPWLLERLGAEGVTNLLVEGGGEVHASFFEQQLVHRIAFFYAPKILGGREAPRAVGGAGFPGVERGIALQRVRWRRVGEDLMLSARIG